MESVNIDAIISGICCVNNLPIKFLVYITTSANFFSITVSALYFH